MSWMDKKIDAEFAQALSESETIEEATMKWANVGPQEIEEIERLSKELIKTLMYKDRWRMELDVLKMIKPDATLKDYWVLRALTSIIDARARLIPREERDEDVEKIAELLAPGEGEMLFVTMTNIDDKRVISATKGDVKTMAKMFEAITFASQMQELAKRMQEDLVGTLLDPQEFVISVEKPEMDNGDDEEENRYGGLNDGEENP